MITVSRGLRIGVVIWVALLVAYLAITFQDYRLVAFGNVTQGRTLRSGPYSGRMRHLVSVEYNFDVDGATYFGSGGIGRDKPIYPSVPVLYDQHNPANNRLKGGYREQTNGLDWISTLLFVIATGLVWFGFYYEVLAQFYERATPESIPGGGWPSRP